MKTDPLGIGRMPLSIETISTLRNVFGAHAESTTFAVEINGRPFVGSAMLRQNAMTGALTLLLNPSKDDNAKWDGTFDWDAWFASRPMAAEPNAPYSVAPSPVTTARPGRHSPITYRRPALEGGDAA